METKRCTKCGAEKPLTEFGKNSQSSNGMTYWCLQCKREHNEKHRTTPAGIYQNIKGRKTYRKRKPVKITQDEFVKWYEEQPKKCHYCEIPSEYSHLMRKYFGAHGVQLSVDCKRNDVGYKLGNIVLSCDRCNFIKSNIFTYEEMLEIGQKYIKPKWMRFPEITKISYEANIRYGAGFPVVTKQRKEVKE